MLGERGDVRELERLLELRPRARAVAEVQQRLAETHACERLASDRAHLAAEPRGVDQVRAGGLEVVGEQLGLAEHGRGERLAAAGARLMGLRAQALGEAGDAVVGVASREHVLGHAQVGVEDAARELRGVPDLRELAPGMLLPAAVEVGDHRPQVASSPGSGSEPVRLGGQPARALPVARVPGDHAAQQDQLADGPRAARPARPSSAALAPGMSPAARHARACCARSAGHALRGRGGDRLGIGGRRAGLAGAVEELRAQREEGRRARARPRARGPARPTRRRRGRRPRRRPTRPPG